MSDYKNKRNRGVLLKGPKNGHWPCVAKELGLNNCQSSDGLSVYQIENDDGSYSYDATCWSCKKYIPPEDFHKSSIAKELGIPEVVSTHKRVEDATYIPKEKITAQERKDLFSETCLSFGGYRGVSDEIRKFFGHRAKYDKDGNLKAIYYPETEDWKLTGYKCRNLPKDFSHGKVGLTGNRCQLAGQVKFKNYFNERDILIVGGEEDLPAAYQMLLDNQASRNSKGYAPTAVVSPTAGEGSAANQIRRQFDFFNRFENILIGMDNDEAGQAARDKIIECLPKEKVKIVYWTGKDPSNMLQNNSQKQFMSDFYNAKPLVTNGIITSNEVMDKVYEELDLEGIDLCPYMHRMQNMFPAGKLPQGRIVNLIGYTSCGKSSHMNSLVNYLIFNAPEKPGIVSLEATAGQYALDQISIYLGVNLVKDMTNAEIKEYLQREDVQEKINKLWTNEYGDPRWALLDERDGNIKQLEKQMDILVKKHGCRILVVDVLSDILRGSSSEYQEDHMTFQKNMVKSGVTIINVLHARKPPNVGKDGLPPKCTEYDALGSSTFVQSGAINIVINRNKMADNPIEKNTTYVELPKCRQGLTGPAGAWYYDVHTRQVYDRDDYFREHPEKLPEGYDLSISSFDKAYYGRDGLPKFKWDNRFGNNDNISEYEDFIDGSNTTLNSKEEEILEEMFID